MFVVKKIPGRWLAILVVLVGLIEVGLAARRRPGGCAIAINGDLPEPQPLILKIGGPNDGFGFHLPNASGIVNIPAKTAIRLACTGNSNYFTLLGNNTRDIQAICIKGTVFSVAGTTYEFSTLACHQHAVHTAVRSGSSCYNGNSVVDIGFEAGRDFIKTMEICFSDANLNAIWSKYDLVAQIGGKQVRFPRTNFLAGSFYPGLNPNKQYTKETQIATFARLLGSKALANQLISTTTDFYLAKGHLTAKADFVYGSQQRTTFYFINAAPQWQTFNGGNWNTLEGNVRTFADKRGLNLEVYTGTYGVVTYANKKGVQTEMYLYQDENNNNQIPVPAVFWKVVYDSEMQKGVAMVGVNNPFLSKEEVVASSLYWLCDDVCGQVLWVKWAQDDQKEGFGYCCDVNQLRMKVLSIPSFPVTGLLV